MQVFINRIRIVNRVPSFEENFLMPVCGADQNQIHGQ